MKNLLGKLALGALMASGLGLAADTAGPLDNAQIGQKVIHEIRMYPKYSIFDNVKIRVDNGNVELLGQVSQPYKKSDLQRLAAHVTGVNSVVNDLEVLPLSPFDSRLRLQVCARGVSRSGAVALRASGSSADPHHCR
jgi:hyperosmotically inducible protein